MGGESVNRLLVYLCITDDFTRDCLKNQISMDSVAVTVPAPESAEASGKRLNLKSRPLSARLYDMEESEIRKLYDDSEKPFYYARNRFEYRNKAQLRLDEEIKKAMDEYTERSRNLSAYDAIAPPAIAHLLGSIRPLKITDDNRPILITLCNLALDQYNAENQGENFVFGKLVKSTNRCVAGTMYYITFEAKAEGAVKTFQAQVWKRISSEGPPVVKSCSLKPPS